MNKKHLAALGSVIVLLAGGSYLSGVIYFLIHGGDITRVQLTSFPEQWYYYASDPQYRLTLLVSASCGFGLALAVAVWVIVTLYRKKEDLYGAARFASFSELKKAGLIGGSGIIIGRWGKKYLIYKGDEFVLLCAPTRGGKGISLIIPNLLTYQQSIVVLDVKIENFALTSKYRARYGQSVFLFSPFAEDGHTHRYNPFGYVRDGVFCIGDILTIANMLYPKVDPKSKFWDASAANLFLGLALYLKETPSLPFTFGELRRQSSGKGQSIKDHLQGIIDERANSASPLSPKCVDALGRFLNLSDNSRANTLGSFDTPLEQWDNPIFDAATSANDFDLRDVRKKKMSVYIGITTDYLPQAGLILNLFFSQLINLNTKELPEKNADLKYRCLLLMDEFTAMGTVDIIGKSVAYIAGFGLQLVTIVQSPEQIDAPPPHGYGQMIGKNYKTNHGIKISFAPNEEADAEAISKMLGNRTAKAQTKTRGKSQQLSVATSGHQRALMLPQEVKEIGMWRQFVKIRNIKPIMCDKIAYYSDALFVDRLKEVSPSLQALGRKLPTKKQLEFAMQQKELQIDIPRLDVDLTASPVPVFESPLEAVEDEQAPPPETSPTVIVDSGIFEDSASDTPPDF